MRSKFEIKNRYWILNRLKESPDSEICLTGYLNINSGSSWVTFTQIENEKSERIAGHINFPVHKIEGLLKNYREFNHKKFKIKGKPGFYVSRGTKRGCILPGSIEVLK